MAFAKIATTGPYTLDAFRTAAVMIREPEKKKEQEKRRPAGKLSPYHPQREARLAPELVVTDPSGDKRQAEPR